MHKKMKFTSTQAMHHLHLRKRFYLKQLKDYTAVDRLVYIAGPLIPIAIIPQVYEIWINNKTEGASLITWAVLSFTSTIMAWYALKHHEKPLILTYVPLVVLNISVVVGLLVLG